MTKKIMRIIVIAAIAFIFFKATTFGWRPSRRRSSLPPEESRMDIGRLKAHVRKLSEDIGDRSMYNYRSLEEASRYVSEQLGEMGYEVKYQSFTVEGMTVSNIIAEREGETNPREIIILGAHYDTCFNPGADDNASAVAGLLEAARWMADKENSRTIRFIAFVNEEPPFFKTDKMGSFVYARSAKEKKEDIKAVIILESIGYFTRRPHSQRYPLLLGMFYPNKGDFIAVAGNFLSRRLVKKVVKSFKDNSRFPIEWIIAPGIVTGVDFSDHWSFWKNGYPAVMFTDTALYRNPNYHNYGDTWKTLDYESLAEVVRGVTFVLSDLDEEGVKNKKGSRVKGQGER